MATMQAFEKAVGRLNAPPWKKLVLVGPRRFAVRRWARLPGGTTERRVDLFFGSPMTVILPEVISEQIYSYGVFDETVTWLALQAVRPGDIVLDIGAHFGYFTLLFAHLVGNSGRVVSFEPTPSTFSVLKKNAGALPNVTLLHAAAGEKNGQMAMADYGLTYSAWNTLSRSPRMPTILAEPQTRVDVQVMRVDDWCNREAVTPQVIKIDAENFEEEVIRGLERVFSHHVPHVLMEAGSPQAVQAGRFLIAGGYEMLIGAALGPLRVQRGSAEDVLLKHKDVLFVHSTKLAQFLRTHGLVRA